ncbi:hypothetical protein FE257_007577 [Aspergillus nanangensis]|uniref:Uncharacterized protein n=1 Tax=Aspergillus nanangensis TaxID=2582783 RepID=A0AAD4CMJ4_ASPNN|nr:hypothetical protein FE257_007577 [Aspergillus nanangensis]
MDIDSTSRSTKKPQGRWKRTRSGWYVANLCYVVAVDGNSRNFSLSHRDVAALNAIEERRSPPPTPTQSGPKIINESREIARGYHLLDRGSVEQLDGTDEDDDETLVDAATVLVNLEQQSTDSRAVVNDSSDLETSYLPAVASSPGESLESRTLEINHVLYQPALSAIEHPLRPRFWGVPFSPASGSSPHGTFDGTNTLEAGSCLPPFSLGQAICEDAPPPPEPLLPISTAEKARLISHYMQEAGTWCETTDTEMHFTMRSIHTMMRSTAFAAAAMSLASRQLDNVERQQRPVTLELYSYTIQLLLRQEPAKIDASVLATCTLLCVYEMMASDVHEWRRHLKGCASLLQAKKWSGSSHGIVKCCFWAFARIDIWAAFTSGKTTLIPTDFWLDDTCVKSLAMRGDVDDYCNLAILIFARVVNLLATPGLDAESVKPALRASYLVLWDELQTWYRLRPEDVCPLLRDDFSQSRVFPNIVYTRSSSICGNTFYHTGSILLLQMGLVPNEGSSASRPADDSVDISWHARELSGISISNPSHANWVNQLQPLYIAGTVFAGSSASSWTRPVMEPEDQTRRMSRSPRRMRPSSHALSDTRGGAEEYPAEKILLLKHLARIERETGWKTSDRAADLRELWGFG